VLFTNWRTSSTWSRRAARGPPCDRMREEIDRAVTVAEVALGATLSPSTADEALAEGVVDQSPRAARHRGHAAFALVPLICAPPTTPRFRRSHAPDGGVRAPRLIERGRAEAARPGPVTLTGRLDAIVCGEGPRQRVGVRRARGARASPSRWLRAQVGMTSQNCAEQQ
jgi:hypothetical protein